MPTAATGRRARTGGTATRATDAGRICGLFWDNRQRSISPFLHFFDEARTPNGVLRSWRGSGDGRPTLGAFGGATATR
eukprot:scaffold19059_cov114-Isochrysis_galbana.AAC.2